MSPPEMKCFVSKVGVFCVNLQGQHALLVRAVILGDTATGTRQKRLVFMELNTVLNPVVKNAQ